MNNHNKIFNGIHGDLTEFVDLISSILDCPITLEDANHQLLAYSIHNQLSDPVRIETIISRRVPEKIINSLWKEGYMPSLLNEDNPIIIPSLKNVEFGKRAAISIRKNKDVIGFIWALEGNQPFTKKDLDFLQFAAKEGKNQLLQYKAKKKRHQEGKQEFLWKLLTGHFQSQHEMIDAHEELALSLPSPFSIVVFTFPTEIDQMIERHISYMLSTTQKIKPTLYTSDRQKLIILAGPSDRNNFVNSLTAFIELFISQMEMRFDIPSIQGSCGQIYIQYIDAQKSYQEALYTSSLQQIFSDKKDRLINYSTIGIFHYIQFISESKALQTTSQALQELHHYDLKNQSKFISTLYTYLENDGNPYSTAKVLHVHVNTIHYRMKRIAEITGLDLKDPLNKIGLYLELLVQQYKNFNKGN